MFSLCITSLNSTVEQEQNIDKKPHLKSLCLVRQSPDPVDCDLHNNQMEPGDQIGQIGQLCDQMATQMGKYIWEPGNQIET